jgi:hypothetical protein
MQIDFVKVPYTTRPNMIRNTGPVFSSSPDREIIKAKKIELEKHGTDLWAQQLGLESVIQKASEYCNVFSNNIVDLALRLEEDVAVMHKGKLAAICFCFPSGFRPSEIIGMPLSDIHKPVADGDTLVKASPSIARVMCEQPSFRRWVWSINMNPDLSNHPSTKKDIVPQDIDDLYFRVETQTTASVDDDTSLFFVKVDVVPLREVWCQQILDSLNSMTDNILTYKNLHQAKKILNSFNKD